ncbi:hypothetical protein C8F01DRAFT_1248600 [Mycena amicta]|nr:hypothetical protein C8F01DRAFT_1248600 [Mycena amicta]
MPFKRLKRFFSRKNKPRPLVSHPLPVVREAANDSAEVTAINILRSSSARFAVVRELDYTSFPPIRRSSTTLYAYFLLRIPAHPINDVVPASSVVSLASATSSINSNRGTYTVTVHQRRRHASTEFPNANRYTDEEEPLRRNNNSQLLGLRSDPSVASLLDLYDEHGRLPSQAFSNSPPKEGRAQVVRSGSTLRQLLGNPCPAASSDSSDLGDISWAEQFLGETQSIASTASSPGIPTPDTDAHFPLQRSQIDIEQDLSASILDISSLEVELSDTVETPPRTAHNRSPYAVTDPNTPQRASQIFGFLTRNRNSKVIEEDERSLPGLPSSFSSPSSEEELPPRRNRSRSHFSSDSSAGSIEPSRPSTPTETTHAETTKKPVNDVHVILPHGPTKVIVTAATPSHHHDSLVPIPIRGPRGPRAHHRQRSGRYYPSRDTYTALPSRRHVSRSSLVLDQRSPAEAEDESRPRKSPPKKAKRRSILAMFGKENSLLSARQELPRTPIRTGSISRPLPHRGSIRASPARSLELSENGKRMMAEERGKALSASGRYI